MRHVANNGSVSQYEEGQAYVLNVDSFETVTGTYGPQIKFIMSRPEMPEDTDWVFANIKLGKHQGRVSLLRGIVNAMLGRPEKTEIEWVDDETFEVKYADEELPIKLRSGVQVRARGEFKEDSKGEEKFRFTRFAMADPLPKQEARDLVTAAAPINPAPATANGDVNPDDVPF